MRNFNEEVFSNFGTNLFVRTARRAVIVEEVLSNAGSLCLPVQPDSAGTVMNVVAAVNAVDGGMHFDSADFCAGKVLLVVDVVNVIVFY